MCKKLIVSILLVFMIFVVGGYFVIVKLDDGVVVFYDSLVIGIENEGNMDVLF